MNKDEMKRLLFWAIKWTIVAVIVIVALQGRVILEEMRTTLMRHNQLLSAVVNEFRVAEMKRAEMQKALQESLKEGNPEPTEDVKK